MQVFLARLDKAGRKGPGSGEEEYGAPLVNPDVLHARTIYLFGGSAMGGRFQVPLARDLMDARLKGADIHLFDAVAGPTGSVAKWHPLYPGGEDKVILGICRLLFRWGKINFKSVARAMCPAAKGSEELLNELERLMLDNPDVLVNRGLLKSAIGSMPDKAMRVCRAAIEIHDCILEQAKPGTTLGELFDLSVRLADKLGVAESFLGAPGHKVSFIGHGIGLEIIEPYIIARNRRDELEPGMTLALEPKFVCENQFTAGVESVFVVTEIGSRLISKVPVEIFIC